LSLLVLVGACAGAFFMYPRSKPQYCWLVFGPDAKTRALVCLDGRSVLIDREDDGKQEQFASLEDCKEVVLTDPDGKTCGGLGRWMRVVKPVCSRLTCHKRRAAPSSEDAAEEETARFCTKYLPLTFATSAAVAR